MRVPRGFTVIELVIALVVGSILTSIAVSSYGRVQGRFAVRGARSTFVALHARARATAIEKGATVRLAVYPQGDSVLVTRGDTVVEKIRFGREPGVDIQAGSANLVLCMSPRGYADTGCTSFSSAVTLTFRQNADTASVRMLPLGQLIY